MYSDFNLHLPEKPIFADDLDLTRLSMQEALDQLSTELQANKVQQGNIMILDSHVEQATLKRLQQQLGPSFTITVLIDPRKSTAYEQVEKIHAWGCHGIKFHPYFQNICDDDFYNAIGVARHAQQLGLYLALCCSYGTEKIYNNKAVKLLSALVQANITMPIVALHSGGPLILDVMSIAFAANNIYLETSFSLPFWLGSSVETDFAFAYKKLGASRVLFGSDRPYQGIAHSIEKAEQFFQRHHFSQQDITLIMRDNGLQFCQQATEKLSAEENLAHLQLVES